MFLDTHIASANLVRLAETRVGVGGGIKFSLRKKIYGLI